ncbi:MAG: hypothetical protein AAFR70_13230, partial [Pseudomonadota bacterium]
MLRLVAAGGIAVGFAALASALPSTTDDAHVAAVTTIAVPGAEQRRVVAAPTVRTDQDPAAASRRVTAATAATEQATASRVPAVVIIRDQKELKQSSREQSDARIQVASVRPGDRAARSNLVGDIQRELSRVGCYRGRISRRWTKRTRRAMDRFIASVNARLPTNKPDFILLALLRGQPDQACGRPRKLQTAKAPPTATQRPQSLTGQPITLGRLDFFGRPQSASNRSRLGGPAPLVVAPRAKAPKKKTVRRVIAARPST